MILPSINAFAAGASIFSTSTDWEAISGLRLKQTTVNFTKDMNLIENGLELYFLDSFPCFAQTGKAHIWLGNKNTDGEIRLTCLYTPTEIQFAWRNSKQDESQNTTTGILYCPAKGDDNVIIDLSKCKKNAEWKEYK